MLGNTPGQMGQVSMLGEMRVPLPYLVLGFNLHLDQYVHLDSKLAPSPAKPISTFRLGHRSNDIEISMRTH